MKLRNYDVFTVQGDVEFIHPIKQEAKKLGITNSELLRRMWELWLETKKKTEDMKGR